MRYFLSFIAIFLYFKDYAQCTVSAFSSPDTVVCGSCVTLSAFGSATGNVAFQESFNGGTPVGWQFTQSVTVANNTCGLTSPDGTDFMWMGSAAVNPRDMTTVGFDLTLGGSICFDMVYAQQGNTSPCEGPDEPDEGVFVQYSIDNGVTWIDISYYDPNGGNDPSLINWNTYCINLPLSAQTTNTMIRWHQDDVTGSEYDHWGIDNVTITLNDPNYTISWLHDGYSYGVGNSGGDNPTDVCINTTTSYTVQMTDGVNTCTDVVQVVVIDPNIYVNAGNDTTICPGDCANLNGDAYEIVKPAKTPTFSNTEVNLIAGTPSIPTGIPCASFGGCTCWNGSTVSFASTCPPQPGSISAGMNINVQNMNQTAVGTGLITSVCIRNFSITPGVGCTGTNLGSVRFVLICPDGTEVILVPEGALTGNTINNMCFQLGAGSYTSASAPYTGTYAPANSWAALNGCTTNGVWRMEIRGVNNQTCVPLGSIVGWSISFDDPQITAPVNYVWSPTAGLTNATSLNPNICPTATNTYTLSATDLVGCLTVSDAVTITLGTTGTAPCGTATCTPPTLSNVPTHVACTGGNNGAINLTTTGTSTYTYLWSNSATTEDISGLTAGNYTVTVTDQSDATCTATATVTINPGTQPTVTATASSNNVCPGTAITLSGGGATTYTWNNGVTNGVAFAAPATTTTYTVTGTNAGGCTNTATVTLTVVTCTTPNASFIPSASTICSGDCISFNNTSTNIPMGSLVGWNLPGATPSMSTMASPTNVCYPNPGTYWVTLAYSDMSFNIIDSTGIAITVNTCTTTPPVADFSASNTTLCAGNCINFTNLSTSTATGGITTWAWDFGNGQTSSLQNPTNICYATAGNYTVILTVTDANGNDVETKTNFITVTACTAPSANFTISQTGPICKDSCVTFTSTSSYITPATFSWNFGNGQTNVQENPGSPICFNTPGTYNITLTVTDVNGTDTENQTIVIEDCSPPSAGFSMSETVICENECIFINNTSTNGTFYQWTFEQGTPPASFLPFPGEVCFTKDGIFTITLVAGNIYGSDTVTNTIVVNPSPNVQASDDQNIISSQEVQISAVSSDPNVTYVWSPTTWLDCPQCASTTVAPEDTTKYVVTVTNDFGCSDSASVVINVEYIEEIGVPSAFSPNGDKHNDILYVQGAGIKNLTFRIFNRYGQMVFESNDQEYGWDGTFQGKDQNTGVFVYYVIYDNSTSEKNLLEGNVTLIR